jgi:hypothetical protein
MLDWDEYDKTTFQWLGGSEYNWNIEAMKGKCDMDLVDRFYVLYFGTDDEAAGAIIKQVSNKGESYHIFILCLLIAYNIRQATECKCRWEMKGKECE